MTENKPQLLDQVRQFIRIKRYSLRSKESYINWIKRFIFFHNKKPPIEMAKKEIGEFITHLAKMKKFQGQLTILCWVAEIIRLSVKSKTYQIGEGKYEK